MDEIDKLEVLYFLMDAVLLDNEQREAEIVDGKQRIIRHLNGDQTHQGRHVRITVGAFQIQHFKLYRYL